MSERTLLELEHLFGLKEYLINIFWQPSLWTVQLFWEGARLQGP